VIGIAIPPEAIPYLQMQRGAISDFRADQGAWIDHYLDTLASDFRCIEPYLPATCDSILDVGSGLGGINILLAHHFGEQCEVTLLDGFADRAIVESHATTFNDMEIAKTFLRLNGVPKVHCLDANSTGPMLAPCFFDLVISLKAWCFHIEPARYAEFVRAYTHSGSKIIVDMRHPIKDPERSYEWMRQMTTHFKHRARIHYGVKFETHLFEVA
jgi:SAM-dependent methyltransferase